MIIVNAALLMTLLKGKSGLNLTIFRANNEIDNLTSCYGRSLKL